MKNNTLAIALAALLVGGVATAAFMNNRAPADAQYAATQSLDANGDVRADETGIPASGRVEYADVVDIDPITEKQDVFAQVIGTEPVRETSTTSTPREVCEDVVVQAVDEPHRFDRIVGLGERHPRVLENGRHALEFHVGGLAFQPRAERRLQAVAMRAAVPEKLDHLDTRTRRDGLL